jgi:hypothetical protein
MHYTFNLDLNLMSDNTRGVLMVAMFLIFFLVSRYLDSRGRGED